MEQSKQQTTQEVLSISGSFWCVFISIFPVVGLGYILYMSTASKNKAKRNLARALLILRATVLVFGTLSAIGVIWLLDTLI